MFSPNQLQENHDIGDDCNAINGNWQCDDDSLYDSENFSGDNDAWFYLWWQIAYDERWW